MLLPTAIDSVESGVALGILIDEIGSVFGQLDMLETIGFIKWTVALMS
jgi:hypothetical protein